MNKTAKTFLTAIMMSTAIIAVAQTHTITRPTTTRPATNQQTKKTDATKPATTQISTASRDKILSQLAADMVYVEGGTFMMGATKGQDSNPYSNEYPDHKVTVSSFYLCKHEVTQEEWITVMGSNPSNDIGMRRAVVCVRWDACQEFIDKLNALTGKHYRLPTEAEWEYAARGGNQSKGYKYSGGDDLASVAWYYDNSKTKTHEVMQKQPNELGLYDMSGNVWEWCQDWYGRDYYRNSPIDNPKGPSSGEFQVRRGGGWGSSADCCRVAYRNHYGPQYDIGNTGLRLAI